MVMHEIGPSSKSLAALMWHALPAVLGGPLERIKTKIPEFLNNFDPQPAVMEVDVAPYADACVDWKVVLRTYRNHQ